MRLHDDLTNYAEFLLDVGEDRVRKEDGSNLIQLPATMVSSSFEDCMHWIYPTFDVPFDSFSSRAILAPNNKMVRQINNDCISRFPGALHEYLAIDDVPDNVDPTHYPPEMLNTLEFSGIPPFRLQLKVGSPFMVLRNINTPQLCNGTRLIVVSLHDNLLVGRITSGMCKDDIVMIPRMTLTASDHDGIPLRRRQFPVQSCFAMTIHKAQGQTLDRVLVHLEEAIFDHGQLYVALSRVTHRNGVRVFLPDGTNNTQNIVLHSMLE